MLDYLRFKYRRQFRRLAKQSKLIRRWAFNYYERHIWGKWRRLGDVRRFILVWGAVLAVSLYALGSQLGGLSQYYLKDSQLAGGRYTEAVMGEIKNINPILPEGAAAADATRLVFSGLTRSNAQRQLEPDLAESWQMSADGKTYTFHLRPGVKWHDDVPLTAEDVVFTILAIQTPDTRSPLATSWQGVEAEAVDDLTVKFTLPSAYAPFLHATTLGILPRHKLELVEPRVLRAHEFNQQPVGTGPFKVRRFRSVDKVLELEANPSFYRGRPLLDEFQLRWFSSQDTMLEAYAKKQVDGLAPLATSSLATVHKLRDLELKELNLSTQTNLFFKTTHEQLKDAKVRQALALAINREEIVSQALDGGGVVLRSPILPGQIGYSASRQQPNQNLARAAELLDEAGWKLKGSTRQKSGDKLAISIVTRRGGEYERAAEAVARQWRQVGVEASVKLVESADLQQTYIRPRNFEALLFGINIGADPDPYPYWHSSQASDPGLNISQYTSRTADLALESGRIVKDGPLRAAKYQAFTTTWLADTPGVVLYSAYYLYAQHTDVLGFKASKLVTPADRFYAVEGWSRQTQPAPKLKK